VPQVSALYFCGARGLIFSACLGKNLSVLFEQDYVFLKQMRLWIAMLSRPLYLGPRCSPESRNRVFLNRLIFGFSDSL
jgi:hypothetical protein